MNTPVKHATAAQIEAVSASHDVASDDVFAQRVAAVTAALASGTDVKTLAADMMAASKVKGSKVRPVGQSVLGYARAVATTFTRAGLTLDTSDPAQVPTIAATYRAIERHGSTVAVRDLVADAIKGKTPAAKLTNLRKSATAKVADAVEARKSTRKSTRVTPTPAAGTSTAASILKGHAERIRAGKLEVSAEYRAALALLVETVAATPAKVAATPATVAAKVPAKV